MGGRAQTFLTSKLTLKPYYGAFSGNLKRVFLRKMHFCVHPFQPKNDHFWSPEGPFLAKNLENKVFSVHTIQNFPICNPNVAPKKVTIFGPRDPPDPPIPPLTPPGVRGSQKWPKCIPSSPIMIMNAKKAISGGSKILTYFFTRNVPADTVYHF